MPRLPRVQPADVPAHIVQRGNNRGACFFAEADYGCYLRWLTLAAKRTCVRIHAYALMTNHVHLLASPAADGGLARMMQQLGRNYAETINKRYGRTGSLWEARYRASLVDSETYLLEVYRYIDLNPVRAGLVPQAEDYPWSSARAHLGMERQALDDHPLFESLGADLQARAAAYRGLLDQATDERALNSIRSVIDTGEVLGDDAFRARIEALDQGRVRHLSAGRKPRSAPDKGEGQATLAL